MLACWTRVCRQGRNFSSSVRYVSFLFLSSFWFSYKKKKPSFFFLKLFLFLYFFLLLFSSCGLWSNGQQLLRTATAGESAEAKKKKKSFSFQVESSENFFFFSSSSFFFLSIFFGRILFSSVTGVSLCVCVYGMVCIYHQVLFRHASIVHLWWEKTSNDGFSYFSRRLFNFKNGFVRIVSGRPPFFEPKEEDIPYVHTSSPTQDI